MFGNALGSEAVDPDHTDEDSMNEKSPICIKNNDLYKQKPDLYKKNDLIKWASRALSHEKGPICIKKDPNCTKTNPN
jgi:hypothetical protein